MKPSLTTLLLSFVELTYDSTYILQIYILRKSVIASKHRPEDGCQTPSLRLHISESVVTLLYESTNRDRIQTLKHYTVLLNNLNGALTRLFKGFNAFSSLFLVIETVWIIDFTNRSGVPNIGVLTIYYLCKRCNSYRMEQIQLENTSFLDICHSSVTLKVKSHVMYNVPTRTYWDCLRQHLARRKIPK